MAPAMRVGVGSKRVTQVAEPGIAEAVEGSGGGSGGGRAGEGER
jgi:hypothetical protein